MLCYDVFPMSTGHTTIILGNTFLKRLKEIAQSFACVLLKRRTSRRLNAHIGLFLLAQKEGIGLLFHTFFGLHRFILSGLRNEAIMHRSTGTHLGYTLLSVM